MESAEPEVLALQAELDEKYKNLPPVEESKEQRQKNNGSNEAGDQENGISDAPKQEIVNSDIVKEENKEEDSEKLSDEKVASDKTSNDKNEHNHCESEKSNNSVSKAVKNEKDNENDNNNDKIGSKDLGKVNNDNDDDNDHNDEDEDEDDAEDENNDNEKDQKTKTKLDSANPTTIKKENEPEKVDTDVKMEESTPKKENAINGDDGIVKVSAIKVEDKITETIANGDKFNHINNLHNGKDLNGSVLSENGTEVNWFSILPRETCDTPGSSTKQIFGVAECNELKIPMFPPPASPGYDRCDSPAPLVLTQDEATQLEYLKIHGLPPQGEAKPVPKDLRCGWWRITDVDTFQELMEHLHSRGVRERELKRTTWAAMESFLAVTGKIHVDPGNVTATDLSDGEENASSPAPIPKPDDPNDWSREVALRVDAQLLEQVEALEDKVANASMQVKGWKLPPRAGTEEAEELEKLHEMEQVSAVEQARQRLLSLEAAIERRYLKPPLGVSTGDPNLSALKAEQAAAAANASASTSSNDGGSSTGPAEENTPRGLNNWREATARAHTSAQLAMSLYMLEASIAWDKSIMKANCQFCHSGDNEDKLLLCDGCDRGYHTYCFRPIMENIPDGDWYCHECMNKATGERNCLVCGKRVGKNLVLCELCPRAYHTDCHNPVMPKMPRGKWYCSNCHSKQPKKRNSSRRSHKGEKAGGTRDSESSDHPPASPTPSTTSNTHVEDVSSSEPPTPTASPRKEGGVGKSLTKKQQRELAPCKILLEQLEQQDEAWPFLLPVNTKQFPTYKKIIKTPMDLSTIKKKLQDCVYKSRDDFCADVRQMFINCEVFNEDDSPVGKAGHGMRNFFETRWTELTGAPPPPLHPQTHS